MEKLRAKNADLVLSTHTLYELAKTFRATTAGALARGRRLFTYLRQFIDPEIPCAKENMEILAAEMWALKLQAPSIAVYLPKDHYLLLSQEVEKLANGDFDERAAKFIKERGEFASSTRLNQIRYFESRTHMKRYLRNVSQGSLEQWLQMESLSAAGVEILTGHILKQFPEAPKMEATEYASALLNSSASRMARGLVRADLYYNWRCANRDSNPKDLIDDIYHVLNSVHCGVYASEEGKQLEYAELLLTANTRVAIYDGQTPVDSWLESLA
jgi:hypothetical protein